MALRFASGTARFVTGKFNNKKAIKIQTPSADVFVRGTDFTITTTPETGASLVILLPDQYGNASGEIAVETAAGQVILNQPYQATTATTYTSAPSKPVTLDITLDLIDNMLIVNPPKERENIIAEETQQASADYLDFADLDIDFLAEDFLDNSEELTFTELDINYLDVNFLEDLLNVIEEVNELDTTKTLLKADLDLQGTTLGFDAETQINTFTTDTVITFYKSLEDTVRLDLDKSSSYTFILVQNGKSTQIVVNGGASSRITITQGD